MDLLTERLPELRDTTKWPVPFRFEIEGLTGLAAANGLLVATDYSSELELGVLESGEAGRYTLPRLMEALIDRPGMPRLQLRIAVGAAGPVCTRLVFLARPDEPLRAAQLRVRLDELVREIATLVGAYNIETGNHDREGFERELAALAPAIEPGKRLSDEHFAAVADVYRYALRTGRPATASVGEAFNVSRSTAGRWVVEARRRGLLGPARPGVAGELEQEDNNDG
jgi:hypothetical protein